ncbi:MAG: hypothetical protein K2X82_10330 [Gemmataceae bacterium]|nr:hypothetical protein [Gemmataceae bacterium]
MFYVALTRAQQALVLVGADGRPQPPDSRYYGWQDEVLAAWPALAPLGAVAGP